MRSRLMMWLNWKRWAKGFSLLALSGAAALTLAQPFSSQLGSSRQPQAEFHMARLIYADTSGGGIGGSRGFGYGRPGWWAIDYPEAEYHFTRGLRRLSRLEVADD